MKASTRIIINKIKQGRGYKYTLKCNYCHKEFILMGKEYNSGYGYYCGVICANKGEHRGYKGKVKLKNYIGIKTNDPRANYRGYYPEHRLVMEKYIKRKLSKKEYVHHKNGNTQDNRIENLEIKTPSEHANIHCPKTGKEVKCNNCNKIIYKNLYVLKLFKNYYCSRKCYLDYRWNKKYVNNEI